MDPTLNIIALLASTIVLGYVGTIIFKKTKIPDLIWLLTFGVVAAVSGFVTRESFLPVTPVLSAMALLIILFDAGLNTDFRVVVRSFPRSMLLTGLGMFLCIVTVGVIGVLVVGLEPIPAFVLGAILAGTSSAVVLAIIKELKIRENVKTILNLESILSDALCVIATVALLSLIAPAVGAGSPILMVVSAFGVGILFGSIFGVVWLILLNRLKDMPFDYMITLAMILIAYVGSERIGGVGSGAIAAFSFGLVLGNRRLVSRVLKREYSISATLKKFHSEITFFIRAFFFVYLGIVASIEVKYLAYGIVIAVALIVVRMLAVQLSMRGVPLLKHELNLMRIMGPKGLAAAVLAGLPLTYGVESARIFPSIVFVVIFATVIYASVYTIVLSRKYGL